MTQSKPNIIIIGGNFAGFNSAKQLSAHQYNVTVVDNQPDFEWLPHIHELISRHKKPEQLRHNRQQLVERIGHTFINNTVTDINKSLQIITLANGSQLAYDHLIIAIGNNSLMHRIEGAKQYAISFDNINEAEKAALQLQRLDSLSLPSRPVVLVGAGIEGIEVLGEIIRRYQRQWRFQLHVIEQQSTIMSKYQGLDSFLKQQCQHLDIQWHLGTSIQQVCKDKVVLNNGKTIPSRLTLWCAGAEPPSLLLKAGLSTQARYAAATKYLQSIVAPNIWLAGDCAELRRPLAKQDYYALPMGKLVAENIQRHFQNKPLEAFKPLAIPSLMSFGEMGFLLTDRYALASPSLIAAKEGVFQANFNLIKIPHTPIEWLNVKESLQFSALNMRKLAHHTWKNHSLFNAKIFKVNW